MGNLMSHFNSKRDRRGPEGKQGPPGPGLFNWRDSWAPGDYKLNDIVRHNNAAYIAIKDTNTEPPSEYWRLLCRDGMPGLNGVRGLPGKDGNDGKDSTVAGPKGDRGDVGPAGKSFTYRGRWDHLVNFSVNDWVTHEGASWVCLQDHNNQHPSNPKFWACSSSRGDTGLTGDKGDRGEPGPPGNNGTSFRWLGQWNSRRDYQEGDVVKSNNRVWICIKPHSNQDVTNESYWDLMLG